MDCAFLPLRVTYLEWLSSMRFLTPHIAIFESFLLVQVRTMKANYTIEAGDVRVIRPLVYVRERSTRDFSQEVRLPVINENCPACFEEPKVRRSRT